MTAAAMKKKQSGTQAEFVAATKWKTGEPNEAGKCSSQAPHRLL